VQQHFTAWGYRMTDMSALLSAVKPKDRSAQYVVLSALFSLNAHTQSVRSGQIGELLRLHKPRNIPANLSDSLRKYKAYVSPVKGPPLKWKLTEKGIEHLRELSGLALSTAVAEESYRADIGIICALGIPELTAVLKALGGPSKWTEVGDSGYSHVYRETTLQTTAGKKLRVIATTSTSMGLTAAAIVATQLILQFRPRLVAMIGIAAGTKPGGKQFGDVLVADPSVDYNSGKVVFENGVRDFQPDPYPISLNPRLRSVLQKYQSNPSIFEEIRRRWIGPQPALPNRLHVGAVGAADQVINDATRIVEIQKSWRKLIGVEMETYGVYRAVNESPEPKPRVVSFKSVCDFADEKSDNWQEYAAFIAAEFAIEFLKREWTNLWPNAL
jgi:nucleoside phosphorylase